MRIYSMWTRHGSSSINSNSVPVFLISASIFFLQACDAKSSKWFTRTRNSSSLRRGEIKGVVVGGDRGRGDEFAPYVGYILRVYFWSCRPRRRSLLKSLSKYFNFCSVYSWMVDLFFFVVKPSLPPPRVQSFLDPIFVILDASERSPITNYQAHGQ